MNIKQILIDLKKEGETLNRQADKCKELHTLAYSGGGALRYDKERVQTSTGNTTMNAVDKLVDEEHKMLDMLQAYRWNRDRVKKIIAPLDPEDYHIVYEHYFQLKSFGQINPNEPYKTTQQRCRRAIDYLQDMPGY